MFIAPSNKQIFVKVFMLVGPDQRKKWLSFGKDLDHVLKTINPEFSKVPFSICFQCLWLSG